MNIYLVTGNLNKVKEVEAILGHPIKNVDLKLDEIQELDPKKIAQHKVLQAWEKTQEPIFVLDQSLYIDCLNGFPGPLIHWFWTTIGLEKTCEIAASYNNHKISTETLLAYYDGAKVEYFSGICAGTIPESPRGDQGWGWDPIFIPEGFDLTYGEMEPVEATKIRSYRIAVEKFREFLKSNHSV